MKKYLLYILVLGVVVTGGIYFKKQKLPEKAVVYKTTFESDEYVRFDMEAYDSILQNYWAPHSQYDLANFFKLALEKASGKTYTLASSTREATAEMLSMAIKEATTTEAKKNIALNTLIVTLYNLQPIGRNGILSTQEETALRQNVANIDTTKNLYQNLGLEKGATAEEVIKAFEKKDSELKASTSPTAKAEREQLAYTKNVLTNPQSKTLYDQAGVEPTIFVHKLGNTLYFYISKISPTTFGEFAIAIDNASTTQNLNSMILDVRGNVGGSLDFLQNFLGLFVGPNQYAFDLFHQGDYQVQRTVQPKYPLLDRYKEIAIITDNMTQSTAELTAATFKRLHLAKTVGTNTRGWGTVENTYPLNTAIDPKVKYTLLLVNSITLRDDNQSIEGLGVDPDVRTTDKTWKNKLISTFNTTSLIDALKQTAGSAPLK
ncbi:MAG: hypothetical protein AB201_01980 [Parcubacteria bacterium C7867-006]|nr:MAG: hypothetical protein AB201_01980 [Parcubacteria bacterium C7867-006]